MRSYPDWVVDLDDEWLARRFGRETWLRGRTYASQGRVTSVSVGGDQSLVQAMVRGMSQRPYVVVIRVVAQTPVLALATSCSCPVRGDCKHAVAVLLHLREVAAQARTPHWARVLGAVTAPLRADRPAEVPLALEFTLTTSGTLALRPLIRGAKGAWIKTGVSWDALADFRGVYDQAQSRALMELRRAAEREAGRRPMNYYSYRTPDTLDLAAIGPLVWELLTGAMAAGVTFVSGRGTPAVSFEAPVTATVEIEEGTDGGLRLRGLAEQDGRPLVLTRRNVLGDPGHGVILLSPEYVRLAPFVTPWTPAVRTMLLDAPTLDIPVEDVGSFLGGYYPLLRRQVPVRLGENVTLPEPSPPRLTLDVTNEPGHLTRLRWGFVYGLGDREVRVKVAWGTDQFAVRDAVAEAQLLETLPPWMVEPDGRPARESVLTGLATIQFATDWLPVFQARDDIVVTISGDATDYRQAVEAPLVSLNLTDAADGSRDWFDLSVDISIDGQKVAFADLFRALAMGEDHLVLDSGTWFTLDRPEFDQLRTLIAEAAALQEGGESGSYRLRIEHAGLWAELVALGVVAEQSSTWAQAVKSLLHVDTLPARALPEGLQATLRPYQETGYRWLSFLTDAALGGVLADDMGLGKTVQTLALFASLAERGQLDRPALVVAPTSVLGTWHAEAARFTPDLDVRIVGQTAKKRGDSVAATIAGAQVVVTSYTLLRLEAEQYQALGWSVVVLDEAQFVKNRQSVTYQAVRRLKATSKFAVTGTPLENNLMDLWSLLSITAPGLFPDPEKFTELYRRPIENGTDPEALARLHRRVRPLMLRRTKEAVAAELPPKQEQVIPVTLSSGHRRLYDKHLQAVRKEVLGLVGDMNRNRVKILAALTQLRQLALSPILVDPLAPAHSAKLETLVEMVVEMAAEGHRALVFSQFTRFLRLAEAELHKAGVQTVYLDGRTRDRPTRIAEFRQGSAPAFLISLKAGGFGLTLTEADYVFVLDPWWNPAAETQAIDRTHRIGQDKNVMVYRLVSADTIEEKVVALQETKRDLFARVVGEGAAESAAPLSADDIRRLLSGL